MTPTEKKHALQEKLQKALELEWSTIPPYLVAYYSLKPEKNRESAALIKSVFMEEMLHMVLAANVLTAIGGHPRLGPANLPGYPLRMEFQGKTFADREFDIHLAAFSPEVIETFLQIELPEGLWEAPLAALTTIVVEGLTIGQFYNGIKEALRALVAETDEGFVFSGRPDHQVPADYYWSAGGGIVEVRSLETALQALDIIIDQGEGTDGDLSSSAGDSFNDPADVAHYFRFNEIKHGQHYKTGDRPKDPPSGPAFDVDFRSVYPIKPDCKTVDFVGDEVLLGLSGRFNREYTMMLRQLEEAFNGNPQVLFSAIMDGMHGIADVARAMMQIPLPDDPGGRHAAPTFEWAPCGQSAEFQSPTSQPQSTENSTHLMNSTNSTNYLAALQSDKAAAFAVADAAANRPYYDKAQDEADRDAYYVDIDWTAAPEALFRKLSAKIRETHVTRPSYKPARELYPWVDLYPDRKLRSIYTGETYQPKELIAMDFQVDAARQAMLDQYLASEGASFAGVSETVMALEAQLKYNCEHSVPQSWFGKDEPMRGDLHHLFACESTCNSTRGNSPFFDYPQPPASGNRCGRTGAQGFEPVDGKGAVARATLYFLLRYPDAIGDMANELQASRLSILLRWHEEFPVDEYELHRNQAIFQRQGNRNPLIDFPQYATLIDFEPGFGQQRSVAASAFGPAVVAFAALQPAPQPAAMIFRFGQPRPDEDIQASTNGGIDIHPAGSNTLAFAAEEMLFDEAVAAAEAYYASKRFRPLPKSTGPYPFRMRLADIIGGPGEDKIKQSGQFIFHTCGDTGNSKYGADAQQSVAFHMERQIKTSAPTDRAALFYHLGDAIYFNGEAENYGKQFYDPYQFYPAPIVAIPGNHDGENQPGDTSLRGFMRNFCTPSQSEPEYPGDSMRLTMTQPNPYFTLQAPFVTIIGLYSNVPGLLDHPQHDKKPQYDWLVNELKNADEEKFLIIAIHHPPYSMDGSHGSTPEIATHLDLAFAEADRAPDLVLAGHVHNYQRFLRKTTIAGEQVAIPYVVAGAGGYAGFYNLHKVSSGNLPADVSLEKSNDRFPGFLRITASADTLKGEYFVVPRPPDHRSKSHPAELFDTF